MQVGREIMEALRKLRPVELMVEALQVVVRSAPDIDCHVMWTLSRTHRMGRRYVYVDIDFRAVLQHHCEELCDNVLTEIQKFGMDQATIAKGLVGALEPQAVSAVTSKTPVCTAAVCCL